jgi:exonuclease III
VQADRISSRRPDVVVLSEYALKNRALVEALTPSLPLLVETRASDSHRGLVLMAKQGARLVPRMKGYAPERTAAARLGDITVVGLYAPTWGDEEQLMRFWNTSTNFLASIATEPVIVTGDLNLGYSRFDRERGSNAAWRRFADPIYGELLSLGFVDAFREKHPFDRNHFSFVKKLGTRVDHIFLSRSLRDRDFDIEYDHKTREAQPLNGRASDHSLMFLNLKSSRSRDA